MAVLAISMPVTVAREKAVENDKNLRFILAQVLYIYYPINFGKKSILTLLDLGSEVNAIHLTFTKKLGLSIRPTNVEVQKIDDTTLNTYRMVVTAFLMMDKTN